ncbi:MULTISPECIES: SpoIIIAH-like family protein [unclassified Candidatus Frackibacter]|uniref:SpoIIIAH-like family protein n=1 Tax=unclassified Candidatus Frackibacter TaxID=2648818 RepID=UPI00087FEDBB|nr:MULTISPECIES: SpoIIIAH-like family protein [unclassified Candidatus Frackibacter]SDC03011.1 stage III sporulation protein AH [Candidatus Frackibacter sp. WG11]SEM69331.1 stage III sporulation protein AH [Candidatus Frackibacter sp. WG12]SFL80604.1 stage III sporulation protein AH [Candidatus Frackibacter sp. WG13]
MSIILKKKFVWFLVLMLWVGMLSAIIIYNTDNTVPVNNSDIKKVKEEGSLEQKMKLVDQKVVSVAKVNEKAEEDQKNFFVEYRLERDKIRSEQVNLLREMINNPNSNQDLKSRAQNRLLNLTKDLEKEMEIESLIRARGYKDAIAYIHQNSVDIIIATKGLEKKDVAKIGDIVAKTTDLGLEDITIIEKKD